MQPKTTLKNNGGKATKIFLKGHVSCKPSILDLNSFYSSLIGKFPPVLRAKENKQSQTLNPDHISFRVVDDAKKWRAFSQAVET